MTIVTYATTAGRTARVDVPDYVAAEWQQLCYATSRFTPVNRHGLPLRPFAAGIYNGDAVDAGVFVDWQHDTTREFCFTARRAAVVDQPTHRWLAETFGPFQHPLQSYRAADCWARRVDRPQARGGQRRDPAARDYRRYSRRIWSPAAVTAATAQARQSGSRCIGVELEFNHLGARLPGSNYVTARAHDIARAAIADGMRFVERWGHYGRNMSQLGWQGTYDSTTTGGEIISDILAGDDASMDEIRRMLGIIRDHGGVAGERQGVHVHVDCRDLDAAAKTALVDNLRAVADVLNEYLPASRRSGYWCGSMDSYAWNHERASVAAGRGGSGSHNQAFNFGHLYGPSPRIEFRQFGHSLNSAKLRCWIRVCQALVTATKAGERFGAGVTAHQMVGILANHGLSQAAGRRFVATCDRRMGRVAA